MMVGSSTKRWRLKWSTGHKPDTLGELSNQLPFLMFVGFRIRLRDLVWLVPAVTGMTAGLLATYPSLWNFVHKLGI